MSRPRIGRLVLAAVGLVAVGGPAFSTARAQSPQAGRVVGRVVDGATGEPLVGGIVMVEETGLGNVARNDGSYFINGVPAGKRRITSEYLGYGTVTHERRIHPGETVVVDFELPSDHIETAAIEAVIQHEPWTPPESLARIPVVVVRSPVEDAPRLARSVCSARVAAHGAYIWNGRWQFYRSVRDLSCREEEEPVPEAAEATGATRNSPVSTAGR